MAAGSIPIKKVYIDSRFKTKDSKSNSDFKYELVESIQLPDKCIAYVDDVIVPVSWYNIDETNRYLYIRRFQDLNEDPNTDRIVPIEVSNHTPDSLTDAVQDALNTAFGASVFSVSYDPRKLKLSITAESQSEVKVFTDDELRGANDWQGPAYNSSNLMSANEVLGHYTSQFQPQQTFESGIVDLRRVHNVYISSANLSTFKTLGPRGECNIIKKVPVTTEYGFTIIDNIVVSHDWIDVSKQLLKTLEFRLSDAYGRTIDLRGMPISFSLIFMQQDD
jgi:hypothetical protein